MTTLSLGDVVFQSFEVPSRIAFGGQQKLAVHKLIGGQRVVDALGRDDGALSWCGVLTGPDAADRSRMLDNMRASGSFQYLSWNAYSYLAVISNLRFDYCSAWWIPYQLTCTVVRDLAQVDAIYNAPVLESVASDLLSIGRFVDPSSSSMLSSIASDSLSTSSGRNLAIHNLLYVQRAVTSNALHAQSALTSDVITEMVTAAGAVANGSVAQGFLARAITNMGLLGMDN